MKAIGLVETKGLIGLVAATDAMVKAANVEVVKRIEIGGGLVTAIVSGDVGSVRAAVESGARVADGSSRRAGGQPCDRESGRRRGRGFPGVVILEGNSRPINTRSR